MNSWPTLRVWIEFIGIIALESLILFAVARLVSLRLQSAQWQRALWQITFVAMWLVCLGELNGVRTWLAQPVAENRAPESSRTLTVTITEPNPGFMAEIPLPETLDAISPELAVSPVSVSGWERRPTWPAALVLTFSAALMLRIITAQMLTLCFRTRSRRWADAELQQLLFRIAALLGVRRRITLARSTRAHAPFTFGITRPVIVLPQRFKESFGVAQREAVLVHEVAHVAGFDSAWRAAAQLLCAVLWWNPVAWLAKRELERASELAADEASLLLADGPNHLAECLLLCARSPRPAPLNAWLGMDGGNFRSSVGRRIARLLRLPSPSAPRRRVPALMRIVAPLLCVATLWIGMSLLMPKQVQRGWNTSILGSVFAAAADSPKTGSAESRLGTALTNSPESIRIEVARLVQEGKLLYETGRLAEAEVMLQAALKLDPGNQGAAYYLDLMQARGVATRSREPINEGGGAYTSTERMRLQQKLQSIRLDEWGPIDERPLSEVLGELTLAAYRADPDHKGVNFVVSSNIAALEANLALKKQFLAEQRRRVEVGAIPPLEEKLAEAELAQAAWGPMVRLQTKLQNITLENVLNILVTITDRKIAYAVEDYGVVFSPRAREVVPLHTRFFRVSASALLEKMGEKPSQTNHAQSLNQSVIPSLKKFMSDAGVDLNAAGKAVFWNDRLGMLMVRATLEDLDAIEKELQLEAASTAQASANSLATNAPVLHTRFFKVDIDTFDRGLRSISALSRGPGKESALDRTFETNNLMTRFHLFVERAGVDLSAEGRSALMNRTTGELMVRATLKEFEIIERAVQMLNTVPQQMTIHVKVLEVAHDPARGQRFDWFLGNVLQTNSSDSANAKTVGPAEMNSSTSGRNGSTSSPAPTITGILTDEQFRNVVRALESRGGTDLLSAPEVTTQSGRQAQIKVVDIRYIVTALDHASNAPPAKGTATNTVSTGGDGSGILPIAQPFEIGSIIDVVPYVLVDGRTIQVTVIPQLREFLGYDDSKAIWATGGPYAPPDRSLATPIPLPKFRLRQAATTAVVWDGQTLVVGAGSANHMQRERNADGTLTHTQTNKHLFFFITPRLIDPAGNRLHSDEELKSMHQTVPAQMRQ